MVKRPAKPRVFQQKTPPLHEGADFLQQEDRRHGTHCRAAHNSIHREAVRDRRSDPAYHIKYVHHGGGTARDSHPASLQECLPPDRALPHLATGKSRLAKYAVFCGY